MIALAGQKATIRVRQAGRADREAVWRFVRATHERMAQDIPERWTWQYLESPWVDREGATLPLWIAVDKDEIVGQMGAMPVTLRVGETTVEAAWGVDFLVRPGTDARVAIALSSAVVRRYGTLLSISMTDATREILKHLKAFPLPPVRSFLRLTRVDARALKHLTRRSSGGLWSRAGAFVLSRPRWGRLAVGLVNAGLRAHNRLKSAGTSGQVAGVAEIRDYGGEFDALSAESRPRAVEVRRSSRYLTWRFIEHPRFRYRCFAYRHDGSLLGYLTIRRPVPGERNIAVIADLYTAGGAAFAAHALVARALREIDDDGLGVACATSVKEHQVALRKLGFLPGGALTPLCVCRDAELAAALRRPDAEWVLTKGDHDWDRIQPVLVDEPSGDP